MPNAQQQFADDPLWKLSLQMIQIDGKLDSVRETVNTMKSDMKDNFVGAKEFAVLSEKHENLRTDFDSLVKKMWAAIAAATSALAGTVYTLITGHPVH